MPHLHLSLQAMDDTILKRMKRRHLRADAAHAVERARKARPDIVIGADIIAGFPTETDAMFENTLSSVEDLGLTHLHVFPYSERDGTPAARMPSVPVADRKARAERLRHAGDIALETFMRAQIGEPASVLIEKDNRGLTQHYVSARIEGTAASGDVVIGRVRDVIDGALIVVPNVP